MTFKTRLRRLGMILWTLFLSGLFTILPFTLTVAVFNMSFRIVISWLEPLRKLINPAILQKVPYAEVILAIIIIFGIGALYNFLILRPIVHAIESLFFKIPLIRPIYSSIKQLVHAFGSQDKLTFKQVIITEFPRKGMYSLGFLTSELSRDIAPNKHERFFNVFIPTTPNPTSGFCVILPEEEIAIIDLTRQEAMSMIISGGIIQPDRFSQLDSNHHPHKDSHEK
jgi:uncharacterized membrane protein